MLFSWPKCSIVRTTKSTFSRNALTVNLASLTVNVRNVLYFQQKKKEPSHKSYRFQKTHRSLTRSVYFPVQTTLVSRLGDSALRRLRWLASRSSRVLSREKVFPPFCQGVGRWEQIHYLLHTYTVCQSESICWTEGQILRTTRVKQVSWSYLNCHCVTVVGQSHL
jgi:hypothetical protein